MPLRFLGRKNSNWTGQKKKSVHPSQVIPTGHPSKDIQCKMSGVANLTEFILTTYILQPNFPIDQIKEIISQIPMASTLRKKWEMAIAFREGRLTDIMTVGKSMMGLETSNGDQNLPVRQNENKKEKMKLKRSVNEQYQEYASMPDEEREEMEARIRFQQQEIRLGDVEDCEIERERETAGQKAITGQKRGNKKNTFFWGSSHID
ncbi:unnamed protein product [Caenorhabditis nigoni]